MGKCLVCGKKSPLISDALGVCVECIRSRSSEAFKIINERRRVARERFGLPPEPPKGPGIRCGLCANNCIIPENECGYCGLIMNRGGKLFRISGGVEWGVLDWYYDPLPTNCVAEWFCPGCTGRGYPKYALTKGPEYGYYNLAVFYGSCSLDCFYCQNWHYRKYHLMASYKRVHVDELVRAALRRNVSCICFFGGDPSSQIIHALLVSKRVIEEARKRNRLIRICWESNGQFNQELLKHVVKYSLESGGIVKIDVKAWTPEVYKALTGGNVEVVKKSVEYVAKFMKSRPEVPILNISLLVVPGYVDEVEIEGWAKYVSDIDPEIPVSLLAFHPDYLMNDLPPTSRKHMELAVKIFKEYGVTNIGIGNEWLLGDYY